MTEPTTGHTAGQIWDAQLYEQQAKFVHQRAADLVSLLAPQPGERILDLAAGTGELTAAIAAAGAEVVGVDVSEAMVAAARRTFPALEFMVGDGQALSFDGRFDAVFSNAGLHWMLRAGDVARGVARALVPGGRFCAEFGGHGCVETVRRATAETLRALNEDPEPWLRWYFPTVAQYTTLLEAHGLDTRFAVLFDRPTRLEGERGLQTWFELFGNALLTHLGPRRADFIFRAQEICRPLLFKDGGWELDYVRLRIVAGKPLRPRASGHAV
ncbi:MAG TPA: methyltransferase domain-containing protein [Polyangia bacterium]|jgi:ubiquinone/menaquinone biosynthesis C-methylase UbiE|nr:methyltransferase domain-containing protein [Polyangia bacterium]